MKFDLFRRVIVMGLLFCALEQSHGQSTPSKESLEQTLARLCDKSAGWTDAELAASLASVSRSICESRNKSAADSLLGIVEDNSRPIPIRVRVFQTLMECPQPYQAHRVLALLDDQAKTWSAGAESHSNVNTSIFAADSLRAFIDSSNKPGWGESFGQVERTAKILSVCVSKSLNAGCGNEPLDEEHDRMSIILSAPLSPSVRGLFAEQVIIGSKSAMTADRRVCDMLEFHSIARLRQLVGESRTAEPQSIPYAAAFCLGHVGDEASVQMLENLADTVEKSLPSDVGATSFRPRMASFLRSYASMVRAQNTPGGLLNLIGGEVPKAAEQAWLREWAMTKALSAGIDKAEIRNAFMKYDKSERASIESGPNLKVTGLPHPRLLALHQLEDRAVSLGVLKPEELPLRSNVSDKSP